LWTAPSLPNRLTFWWVLDAVRRARLDRARFWIGEPRLSPEDTLPDFNSSMTLGSYPARTFTAAFAELRPLDARTARVGAALWRHFASSSPKGFDRACRDNSLVFADLLVTTEAYGPFFPRVTGLSQVRLRLSEGDQLLLDALEVGAWLRPVDVMRKDFRIIEYFLPFGELFFLQRLQEWAGHSPAEPALLARREPRGPNDFTNVAYRLTHSGDRLRRRGLRRPQEAPPLFVGGCRLYTGSPTWVRRQRGRDWWIERLSP
jgi:hypothetical protein